jgi:hypothetical protein
VGHSRLSETVVATAMISRRSSLISTRAIERVTGRVEVFDLRIGNISREV